MGRTGSIRARVRCGNISVPVLIVKSGRPWSGHMMALRTSAECLRTLRRTSVESWLWMGGRSAGLKRKSRNHRRWNGHTTLILLKEVVLLLWTRVCPHSPQLGHGMIELVLMMLLRHCLLKHHLLISPGKLLIWIKVRRLGPDGRGAWIIKRRKLRIKRSSIWRRSPASPRLWERVGGVIELVA